MKLDFDHIRLMVFVHMNLPATDPPSEMASKALQKRKNEGLEYEIEHHNEGDDPHFIVRLFKNGEKVAFYGHNNLDETIIAACLKADPDFRGTFRQEKPWT